MDTLKIWHIGEESGLFSTLKANLSVAGFVIEQVSETYLTDYPPVAWGDILIIDRGIGAALDFIKSDIVKPATETGGVTTVYLISSGSMPDSAAALTAGYDIVWAASDFNYELLAATLRRDVERRGAAAEATDKSPSLHNTSLGIDNETVMALVDGAVELLKLKEDTEKQNTELRLVRDELEQFVHTVSHDLKEPIMAVKTYSSILIEELGGQDGEAGKYLGLIRESVILMARQIDSLLEFSRAGRKKDNAVVEDLRTLIDEIKQMRGYDRRDDVRITLNAELPVIKGAPEQVKQIFRNLIGNGIKHNKSPMKTVEVKITTLVPDELKDKFNGGVVPDGYSMFVISDNGYGIPGDDHDAPFELFRRLVSAAITEGDGAGLAIVKRAITSLGGVIDYISHPERGTRMYFTLPTKKEMVKVGSAKGGNKRSINQLKAALFE